MRLFDHITRYGSTFWEGQASGAAVILSSYESPDRERSVPEMAALSLHAAVNNPVVFAANSARLALFSEAGLVLQSVADKRLFTDSRLDLLQHPWPDATEGELLARMQEDRGYAGNAYVWAPPGEDRLVVWRPEWVTIISEVTELPGGGWYRQKTGFLYEPPRQAQAEFGPPMVAPAGEVAHWAPQPDPAANFRGMSWLTPCLREIDGDNGLAGYKIQYLKNNAVPGLILKYAQKLQPGTVDALRERTQARHGGEVNAFRTLVLDQGADPMVVGSNLAQMNFEAVQQAGADRILAAAGVPGVLVGFESLKGAGRSYEEVVRRFADITMRPEWRSACAVLQKLVPGLPPRGIRLTYDTADIAALQEGEQTRAQEALIRAQALLTMRNAGYTRDSAVRAVEANDVSQLVIDPDAVLPQGAATQHLLPNGGKGGDASGTALPPGSTPRLDAGTVSPGDGGNHTRPSGRPASVRRVLNGHR